MGLKINGNILEKYEPEENAPDTIFIPDGVEIIGNSAFAQCTVKKIILPESVKEIRDSAFWQSWSEEINIPYGVKKIGKLAFCGNNIIKEINIPPNVTRIGENTFWNCSNVKKYVFRILSKVSIRLPLRIAETILNCIMRTALVNFVSL